MEIIRRIFILFFLTLFACTNNPFWDDTNTKQMKLTGVALAENNQTHIPISIWLEEFDIYSRSDSTGRFTFDISNSQTSSGSFNGGVNLYFYIHNYLLDSVTIYFTNGHFSAEQTDFTPEGELIKTLELKKLLSGEMELHFNAASLSNHDTVSTSFHLESHESISINTYKFILQSDGSNFYSGLYFNSIHDIQKSVIYNFVGINQDGNTISDQKQNVNYLANDFDLWTYYILSDSLHLSSGVYEVYPYINIKQEAIPEGLISHLGGDSIFYRTSLYIELPMDVVPDTLEIP
ncbi:MAG: hypothetical protein HOB40_07225 [Candidatus Marinimicrobia bacterium]|jgi:hypothetical protein|nr:hypothetical protein [Candidatus Neomarinimicrobiota bacterium]MBT3501190.1 hypothetical protein [Candidatus Neomarinimicrobiota bacterium]MBT3839472.1 hypothetical protein [Candidatus Neomarinimicrobiota bacterium]MBT3999372.1 hypothetical protein [Candidatus Neomarinimicrobiota bacterium]MBT4281995.1 hypothetical protein [Candidatus Neomarinimicrobiota bacterium]